MKICGNCAFWERRKDRASIGDCVRTEVKVPRVPSEVCGKHEFKNNQIETKEQG